MAFGDMAYASSQHDGLVITAHFPGDKFLEGTEIPRQIGPPEFVVERRAADGTLQHDLQGRCDTRWLAVRMRMIFPRLLMHFPRLNKSGNVQVGNRETAKPGSGFGATAGGAFVADFSAHSGSGTRIRRNRGGMIVGFHFHQDVRWLLRITVSIIFAGVEACDLRALDNGRIIRISHHCALRVLLVSIAYHREQRFRPGLAIYHPVSVENLVAAVLRIGLGKHHQFHIGGIASNPCEIGRKIVNFVRRQRKPHCVVGMLQCIASARQHIHRGKRRRLKMSEQFFRIVE